MPTTLRVERTARARLPAGASARLRRRAARALRAAGAPGADLSIVLTDDAAIRSLNRKFRGVDRPTDVLSFSQREGEAPPHARLLGDIVISVQTAARRRKRLLEDELFHLLVHGLLHLLGYDHRTPTEARRMFALARRIQARARTGASVTRSERA